MHWQRCNWQGRRGESVGERLSGWHSHTHTHTHYEQCWVQIVGWIAGRTAVTATVVATASSTSAENIKLSSKSRLSSNRSGGSISISHIKTLAQFDYRKQLLPHWQNTTFTTIITKIYHSLAPFSIIISHECSREYCSRRRKHRQRQQQHHHRRAAAAA